MKLSSVVQASIWLALIAACLAQGASRNRITARAYKTNYFVDSWDDNRDEPYRVTFWKFGLKSVYTFDAAGHVKTLTARNTPYTFDVDVRTRKLLAPTEEALEDEHLDRRLEIACTVCEVTWATLCDAGIAEVCFLHANNPADFNNDAEDSVRRFCSGFGKACNTSPADTCDGQCAGPVTITTPAPVPEPTPAPIEPVGEGACTPNPCLNGASCSVDPAGGYMCSCASGYGGMVCQKDTSSLDPFYIELEFVGTWTAARRAVLQSAADRWSEVITHVPCGGTSDLPAGRLLISSTLKAIDGAGGTLGSAGPDSVWGGCNTISAVGHMEFDTADVADLQADGTFEGVVLHEMGHVIGIGTLWGDSFGKCTTCRDDGNAAWTCPEALSTYADIGGTGADIVELDGESRTSCSHLDEDIFTDELMTGFTNPIMYLSKMTAAILDDLNYIVDPSAVDSYTLPSERGASVETEPVASTITDTAVDAIIQVLNEDGDVVEEKVGVVMEF